VVQTVQDFETEGTQSLDYAAFRWGSGRIQNRPVRLKIVNLPRHGSGIFITPVRTPSFRRRSPEPEAEEVSGDQPGYFWLGHLPKSLDEAADMVHRLSPNTESWMLESARLFVSALHRVVESICSRGRSVWLMAEPLRNGIVPTASSGNIAFSHWGILISYLTRHQLQDRIAELEEKAGLDLILGDLHELRNHRGEVRYERYEYRGHHHQRATKLKYLGQTEVTDETLFEFGSFLLCGLYIDVQAMRSSVRIQNTIY
jgi:hypothetical protein